jgi:hypothetical protein
MGLIAKLKRMTSGSDRPWIVRVLRVAASEAYHALRRRDGVPLRKRLACWRHGFFADKAVMYDFDRLGYAPYLSDYERHVRTNRINDVGYVLGDKFVAYHVLRGIGAPTPELYATVGSADAATVEALAREHGALILKPRSGSGGVGVQRVEHRDGAFLVDDRRLENLAGLELAAGTLVYEFARQHAYSDRIFPGSTNTIRLLTMLDSEAGRPFVAAAVHRFGTRCSAPVDNFESGGLTAHVDLASGALGPAIVKVRDGRPVWHDAHPDTGSAIRDTVVPHWNAVHTRITEIAGKLHGIHYAGWDIVITQDGFTILEGNNRPGVNVLQIHRPLLVDERVLRFYAEAAVLRRHGRGGG